MQVIQTQLGNLFTVMDFHFQRSISQAMHRAVIVQMLLNPGKCESELSCAYYYSFLFSGWWFDSGCTDVALNGKYKPSTINYGFRWRSPATGFILPISSEMKIRRI